MFSPRQMLLIITVYIQQLRVCEFNFMRIKNKCVDFLKKMFSLIIDRVKERTDIIGAFKMEPLYLKHENQESGRVKIIFHHHNTN